MPVRRSKKIRGDGTEGEKFRRGEGTRKKCLQALAHARAYPTTLVLSHAPSKEALDLISPSQTRSVEVTCGKLDISVARHLVKFLRKAKQLNRLIVKGGGALGKLLGEFVSKVKEFSLTHTCFDRKGSIQLYDKLFAASFSRYYYVCRKS